MAAEWHDLPKRTLVTYRANGKIELYKSILSVHSLGIKFMTLQIQMYD